QPLAWAHTKSMALTHRVILESLRMASIISFTFREAVADVEYKGFLIPKQRVPYPQGVEVHHSPDYFQDPHKFDPSRFQVAPRPSTFLPFGHGVHACPGNELAKLEMLVRQARDARPHPPPGHRLQVRPSPLRSSPYIPRLSYSLWTRMTHGWLLPLSMGLRLSLSVHAPNLLLSVCMPVSIMYILLYHNLWGPRNVRLH
ncbi:cytochrome P450, partial [Marinobacter salinexigens]